MTASDRKSVRPTHVGFLLAPPFPLLAYACAIEPLRAANLLSEKQLYHWSHISIDGLPPYASNGVTIQPDFQIGEDIRYDYVFVCAGGNPALFNHQPTLAWLRQLVRRGVRVGGISGGAFVLARANLLNGYRVTIHWDHAPALLEAFPEINLRHSLYEIDRDRLTSSGGTSPLDMMHEVISREHGSELALKVSDWLLHTQIREGARPQRMPLRERLGVSQAPLLRAIDRMERNLEQPLMREELARYANVSLRQLERLFRQNLECSLGEHYLKLRLDRARDLLRQTSLSVIEIALATGFTSASHFSKKYKLHYGHAPRAERVSERERDRHGANDA